MTRRAMAGRIAAALAAAFAPAAPGWAGAAASHQATGTRTMTQDETEIAAVLARYEAALNRSDAGAVLALYAPDGVFMPQHSPSSVGAAAVRAAYDAVFRAITLDIRFEVAEVRQVVPDWAFARTNSAGVATLNATGAGGPEANQELFVFQKLGGDWKIARYCFTTSRPRA